MQRLLEVAGFYRSLVGIVRGMPNGCKHNRSVPPITRAERWRPGAEECRSLADRFHDETCRRQLIHLAQGYERRTPAAAATAKKKPSEGRHDQGAGGIPTAASAATNEYQRSILYGHCHARLYGAFLSEVM